MSEQTFIPAPHLQDAAGKLELLRQLVAQALAALDDGDPAQDGDEGEWVEGYHDAAKRVRSKLAWQPPASRKQEMLEVTAVRMGREPGGPTTGWLESLWESAYAEGERNATARLILNLMR